MVVFYINSLRQLLTDKIKTMKIYSFKELQIPPISSLHLISFSFYCLSVNQDSFSIPQISCFLPLGHDLLSELFLRNTCCIKFFLFSFVMQSFFPKKLLSTPTVQEIFSEPKTYYDLKTLPLKGSHEFLQKTLPLVTSQFSMTSFLLYW